MADLPRLTTAAGAACVPGQVLDIGPGGLALAVALPTLEATVRRLKQASLSLSAASAAAAELSPAAALDSDGANVAANGAVDFNDAAKAASSHWLGIDWRAERAITALTVEAPAASLSKPATGARVRMFSAGNWLPLPARDTLSFVAGKAGARFPACAASRLMIELLAENQVSGNWTGVMVPGAVNLTGLKVSVQATPQPCHVSLAIGDDAAFFSVAGTLSAQAVAVEGLARALNRYLTDHPGASTIPLTLRAAASAQIKLVGWTLEQEPAAAAAGSGAAAKPPPPRPEQSGTQPEGKPAAARGRWCDARHGAAQAFDPPPAGSGLSAVELWVRALGDAGGAGSLALHTDAAGRPADSPAAPPVRWQLPSAAGQPASEGWLRCELPLPALAPEPGAPWWAVLRVEDGELLWYLGETAPAGAGAGLYRIDGGPWLPVNAGGDAGAWLQARVRLLALPAAAS